MKIEATPAMKKAFEEFKKRGRITSDAYHYAVAQGYDQATIEKLRKGLSDRVKQQHEARQERRERVLRKPDPVNLGDPTPEWLKKAGKRVMTETAGRGQVLAQKRFRLRGVLEQYGHLLGEVPKKACERLVYDSAYVLRVKIANLEPSGGGEPNKLGGLGNVQPHVRNALARHDWVLGFLSTEARITAKRLVTCELSRNDGAPLTMEEFSAGVMPDVVHSHRRWGFALGALWMLAGQLVHLYAICPYEANEWDEAERDAELGYEPHKRQYVHAT